MMILGNREANHYYDRNPLCPPRFFFIRALLRRPPLQHRHSTDLMRSARRDCLVSIGLART